MGYLKRELGVSTIEAANAWSERVGVFEGSHRKEAANLVRLYLRHAWKSMYRGSRSHE